VKFKVELSMGDEGGVKGLELAKILSAGHMSVMGC